MLFRRESLPLPFSLYRVLFSAIRDTAVCIRGANAHSKKSGRSLSGVVRVQTIFLCFSRLSHYNMDQTYTFTLDSLHLRISG